MSLVSLYFCSALVNFSTRVRVSLGDKSPSSSHLRLERSGGHMRSRERFNFKISMMISAMCQLSLKIYGRNSKLSANWIPSGQIGRLVTEVVPFFAWQDLVDLILPGPVLCGRSECNTRSMEKFCSHLHFQGIGMIQSPGGTT